jgi:hypothetical protein
MLTFPFLYHVLRQMANLPIAHRPWLLAQTTVGVGFDIAVSAARMQVVPGEPLELVVVWFAKAMLRVLVDAKNHGSDRKRHDRCDLDAVYAVGYDSASHARKCEHEHIYGKHNVKSTHLYLTSTPEKISDSN